MIKLSTWFLELTGRLWKLRSQLYLLWPAVKSNIALAEQVFSVTTPGAKKAEWVTALLVKQFPALVNDKWLINLALELFVGLLLRTPPTLTLPDSNAKS